MCRQSGKQPAQVSAAGAQKDKGHAVKGDMWSSSLVRQRPQHGGERAEGPRLCPRALALGSSRRGGDVARGKARRQWSGWESLAPKSCPCHP